MTPEKTQKLLKRFPHMYRGFYKSMQVTCMCWGFDHQSGWADILWMLSLAIEDELNYSWFQKKLFLFKDRASNVWNDFIYWLSPTGTHDFLARVFKALRPKGVSDEDHKNYFKPKWYLFGKCWAVCECGIKMFVWWPYTGFEVVQVKEKFGTLRFYTNFSSDRVEDLISIAERASSKTCEICGHRGQLTDDTGWVVCLCDEHREERCKAYGVELPKDEDDEASE